MRTEGSWRISAEGGRRTVERELAVSMLGCVAYPGDLSYLSAPITSGRRFEEWRMSLERPWDPSDPNVLRLQRANVVEPNIANARRAAHRIVVQFGGRIIDPTRLPVVPEWTQRDYHWVWGEVIQRYATRVYFAEGWMYSNGCVYEFYKALAANKPTLTGDGRRFSLAEGMRDVEQALAWLREHRSDTSALEEILEHLREVSAGREVVG